MELEGEPGERERERERERKFYFASFYIFSMFTMTAAHKSQEEKKLIIVLAFLRSFFKMFTPFLIALFLPDLHQTHRLTYDRHTGNSHLLTIP